MSNISQIELTPEIRSNFKAYGKYLVEQRVAPDIRDGCKPVQRRILTSMINSNNFSNKPFRKVAKTSGDVIGTYHPHGDAAVEEAMARMGMEWKNSECVIEIMGNNGSVFGDPPAAGRYIEARLTPLGDYYGKKLKQGIVNYIPNFDDTTLMPEILPAQLPFLLINGSQGIGAGFATSIPTHNAKEVLNTFLTYIENPKVSVEELVSILGGPDFPTGGTIINKSDLVDLYKTGEGKLRIRGKMRYNPKTNTVNIYEIPFTYSGSMDVLVSKIVLASIETVKKGKNGREDKVPAALPFVQYVRDYSGKDGIDIEIKLSVGTDPHMAMQMIFAKTPMEDTMSYQFIAVNDYKIKTYSLTQYLKEYTAFQHEIVRNEFLLEKEKLERRLEVIKGLIILQTVIDPVVASAKASRNKSELKTVLMTGKVLRGVPDEFKLIIKTFKFSEIQADAIASLPLHRLSKMDAQELAKEGRQIEKDLKYVDSIITNTTKRKNLIIDRHKEVAEVLSDKSRLTELTDDTPSTVGKVEIQESELHYSVDKFGYVKISEKPFKDSLVTTNKRRVGFIDKSGVMWNLHMGTAKTTTGMGVLLNTLIDGRDIIGFTNLINSDETAYGLFVFKDGNMKLTDMRSYMTKSNSKKVGSPLDYELLAYYDVPENATSVTINGQEYLLNSFSVNGRTGHGKRMSQPLESVEITWGFDENIKTAKPKKVVVKKEIDATVIFDGSDTLVFDWFGHDHDGLYVTKYSDLIKSELLFVHKDGTAKIVDGNQFKVSSKRTQIQCNKKGLEAIYIGPVPEYLIGEYEGGFVKKIPTNLISKQGKVGGGVRALWSDKFKLTDIHIDGFEDVAVSTLAMKPKKV